MTKLHGSTSIVCMLAILLVCPAVLASAPQAGRDGITLLASPKGSQPAVCSDGAWDVLGSFAGLIAKDVAVTLSGDVLVIGESTAADGSGRLAILRAPASGTGWELVDEFVLPGGSSATGHRIHVAADGRIYALGLSWLGGEPLVLIRMSDEGGDPGSWITADRIWQHALLGAITSDTSGRVYVALGFSGPEGIGWNVESALHATGAWRLHDHFALTPGTTNGAVPHDLEMSGDGKLLLSGQLNGNPDLWITRFGALYSRAPWRTIDLYALSAGSYGLAGTSVLAMPATDSRPAKILVAGFGVEGDGEEDYLWITREAELDFTKGEPHWDGSLYQLEPGLHSFALDAESDTDGRLLVLGVAGTSDDTMLLLRRSWDDGLTWEDLLTHPGITRPLDARLAVGADDTYVAIANQATGAVVLSCQGL